MGVRAKMVCNEISEKINWSNSDKTLQVVKLNAVSDGSKENKAWAAASPNGSFEIQIDNPEALNQFKVGKSYFVDIAEAVEAPPEVIVPDPPPTA